MASIWKWLCHFLLNNPTELESRKHTEQNKKYCAVYNTELFIIKSSVEADAMFRALFDISSYGKKDYTSCAYWRISGYYIIGGK